MGGSRQRECHLLTTGEAEGGLSTRLSDLVEGYELLRSTSQLDPLYAENGRTILLYEEQSIRIYLTREQQTWNDISLEVEVFLSAPEEMEAVPITKEGGARRVLLRLAHYLDYLLRLEQEGFTLDPVVGDCVWTARRVLKSKPNMQLYKIVSLPEDQLLW